MLLTNPEQLKPRASIETYMMDVKRDDWGVLLGPFSPPLPSEGSVIMASYFGDVFVRGPDGAIWWVNGIEARVDRIADNQDAFDQRLSIDYFPMLKTGLLEQMVDLNKVLVEGRIYGLKTPRREGGKYDPDNIGTAPIADAFAYMGQEFRLKADAKEAAPLELDTPAPAEQPQKKKKKGWFS